MTRTILEELRLHQHRTHHDELRPGALTPRETEILTLIAEGFSTTDVAAKLNYSERTIKAVLHTLITRLNLRNRAHAVAYSVRTGAI
jgi:DNA-binding NarL/FixJ family response regulator